jgi:hypothetical protein
MDLRTTALIEDFAKAILELRSALQKLIGWTMGGTCSDCDKFREGAPRDWLHHVECDHLKAINEAYVLLGLPPEKGHTYKDPKGEMKRLADERLAAWSVKYREAAEELRHCRSLRDGASAVTCPEPPETKTTESPEGT